MKKITKKQIKNFLMINVGVLLFSLSFVFLMEPNNQVYGGVTGISIVISAILPNWHRASYFILFLNILLLFLGLIFISKEFFFKTLYCSIATFIYPWIFEWLLTDDVVSILQGIFNSNGFLIVTICAIFAGFGLGLALKGGASTGGTDILQAILYKYANIPYSKSLILIDGSIVLIGAAILYFMGIVPAITSIISVLYALVYILLSGYMMDQVVFSGFNVRAVHIVTCEKEKVEDYILRKLERGVTVLKAKGAYTGEDRDMLVTVLSQREYYALKDTVYSIDPKAFVYVVKASEVHGEGFSYDSFEQ